VFVFLPDGDTFPSGLVSPSIARGETMKVNRTALCDESRKIGVALIAAGLIGGIVDTDKITIIEAVTMFLIGTLLLIYGLLVEEDQE